MTRSPLPLLALPLALLLAACGTAPPNNPDPTDPSHADTTVPPLQHHSVLANRRGVAGAAAPRPWREANDEVARIGGWRSYLRESEAPATPASAPEAKP